MNTEEVGLEMRGHGLPELPAGHPRLDGKIHRFGKGKKAWYRLRSISLKSGQEVVVGAFGIWQGQDPGTIPVAIDWTGISDEERAEAERKQAVFAQQEADRKARAAELAAGRARRQFTQAVGVEVAASVPYLARKRIGGEGARVDEYGQLLVPARRYAKGQRAEVVSVQKISADGTKRFNDGADMIGAACLLGSIDADTRIIGIAEGYATGQSVRMATDCAFPVMVAFNAGNLAEVARRLRADFPDVIILFLADDDWQLEQRYARDLAEHFGVAAAPDIDGVDHPVADADGVIGTTRATWREDQNGTRYIEADIRLGRRMRIIKFENAGISRARAAARSVGNAHVVWPTFAARGENKWTDFNDLHCEQCLDDVRAQLGPVVANILAGELPVAAQAVVPPGPSDCAAPPGGSPHPTEVDAAPVMTGIFSLEWAISHCALVQGSTDVWDGLNKLRMKRAAFVDMVGKDNAKVWSAHADRRSISPRHLPKTIRGVAVENGGAGEDHIVMMLDRYTLLYGTKTVWDAYNRTILGYDAMALARGNDLASRWIGHPLHREVDLDKLVFDPTQRVDLDTHINMFEGFLLTPKKDLAKAGLVVQLLCNLVSGEANADEVVEWVLRWLAYPLQHPGAKMQTALLFFGEKQGTGKSLFFEGIVKPIYGTHGATGGQHQLESTYTMWRSQKLFVLFEEILSRQDKYSYFGLIKHMITGRDSSISQKFKDDRTEANHLNCVMLSNEFQAVPLEPEDRRFLVVEARVHPPEDLVEAIKAQLDNGLIEAFYAYLLEYPLGDFNPHTKPLMTPSKERVINFGRPDWEAFYLAWAAGDLSVPYCSCLSSDLYIIYSRYCSRYGYRSMSITKFSELIAQRVHKDRQWVALGAKPKKLLTVFHAPGEEGETLSKQCERFRKAADIREDN